MKEAWVLSAIMAAFAAAPLPLAKRVQPMEGGGRYVAEIIPVVEAQNQYIVLTFCSISGSRPTDERRLYPPFATACVSYPDKQVRWEEIDDKIYAGNRSPLDPNNRYYLGVVERSGITPAVWTAAHTQYVNLVSLVLERKWLVTKHAVTIEERATAKELKECVQILYDKPLLPYYQHEGRQFLAWMARAAK